MIKRKINDIQLTKNKIDLNNRKMTYFTLPRQETDNNIIIIIIYHDFLPTPNRGSHVKSGKTHTQSSRYTLAHIFDS